jgi:hypothetical protein
MERGEASATERPCSLLGLMITWTSNRIGSRHPAPEERPSTIDGSPKKESFMPRERDVFDTIEAQARHVLKLIEHEIADLEERLGKLRDQHARWTAVLLGAPDPPQKKRARRAKPSAPTARKVHRRTVPTAQPASPPIDWSEVLKALPRRFTMDDLEAATASLGENRRARIVAIARWSRARQIGKLVDGVYEKIEPRSRKRINATPAVPTSDVSHDVADGNEGDSRVVTESDADIESPAA